MTFRRINAITICEQPHIIKIDLIKQIDTIFFSTIKKSAVKRNKREIVDE